MMAEQLVFDLPVRTALGRDDFFVSEANATAVAMIDATGTWPQGKLALVGPEGAGKSHLAHAWAGAEGARFVTVSDDPAELSTAIVVDDADRWTGPGEEALLHLHNIASERGLPLLLTSRAPPAQWPTRLPDLQSRLSAIPTARIEAPDDALLSAVLAKLFTDRQITPPPELVPFVLPRIERSFAAARDFVERLDAAALAEGRAPGRALAARLLGDGDLP